jgi:hypothetical protein
MDVYLDIFSVLIRPYYRHVLWHRGSSYKMIICTVLNFCDHQELDRQVPLMDEMDDKVGFWPPSFFVLSSDCCLRSAYILIKWWMQVDRANADLKNTNVRLKQTILQVKFSPPMVLSLTDAWVVS